MIFASAYFHLYKEVMTANSWASVFSHLLSACLILEELKHSISVVKYMSRP